jgi:hypothetical protein
VPLPAQERGNVVGLPESELGATGADPQTQALVPLPFLEVLGSFRGSFRLRFE